MMSTATPPTVTHKPGQIFLGNCGTLFAVCIQSREYGRDTGLYELFKHVRGKHVAPVPMDTKTWAAISAKLSTPTRPSDRIANVLKSLLPRRSSSRDTVTALVPLILALVHTRTFSPELPEDAPTYLAYGAITYAPSEGTRLWWTDSKDSAIRLGSNEVMMANQAHLVPAWASAVQLQIDLPNSRIGLAQVWGSNSES